MKMKILFLSILLTLAAAYGVVQLHHAYEADQLEKSWRAYADAYVEWAIAHGEAR